ncbi:MAG: DUF11 domain-containing protein, partial [Planctomycetia bacterium]|nr:DUF11 domain-containing protein [Planctomycetia bacterium]
MRQTFAKFGNQFTRSWKRFLGLNGYRPTSQRPRPRPSLRVEQLEDRLTPADINIDTFNQANLVNPIEILTVAPPTTSPVTTSATDVAANILGTHREVSLVKTTGAQDDSAQVNVAAGRASLNLGVNVGGNVLFIWDGTPGGDAVGTVTTNGLGGFDLATETNRFELRLRGDPTLASGAGTPFRLTVYTEDVAGSGVYVAHSQTRNLTVPNNFVVLAYDYSSFGGANFLRVGAITLETVDPPLGADIDFDLLLARQVADLSLTKTKVTPTTTPAVGDLVTFRLTITNAGPNVADNVTVSDPAVTGLEYVSDNGAGAFNSTTRVWTVGHLDASGAGATKTLDITYRVSGTVAINNYAQITFSSAFDPDSTPGDGSGSGGGNPGHQDDDSTFTFTPLQVDFGDAPNSSQSGFTGSYPTTLADNGARHVATGVRLGSGAPDTEQDGQPNATATGDDAAGTDDENGVTLPAAGFGTGATTPITVNVTNASAGAFLNVWFDFNRDGDWDDAGEHVVSNAAVVNGNNTIDIAVPVTASEGTSFARFRITDAEGSGSSTGLEPTGEVEDYQVTIVKAIDLSLTKGVTDTTPDLGDLVDFTLTVSNAAGLNDAPGVVVRDVLPTGLAFVQVVSSTQGTLTGNDWSVGTVATGASHTLVIRARVTGSGTIVNFAQVQSTTGPADRDSVPGNGTSPTPNEDDEAAVTLTVPFVDFGDAPASYGTMLADGGARHNLIPNVAGAAPRLGTAVDAETDGPAAGTGVEDGADEDGVSFALPGNTLLVNENNEITITGTVGALVDAWIDFDGNGAFDPTTERITAVGGSAIGAGGTLTLTVNPAVGVTLGDTYARFRVSSAGGLNPTGLASDGEVEDYAIRLANRADLSLTKTLDSTGPFNLGDVVQFTLTVTNAGSSPATGVT